MTGRVFLLVVVTRSGIDGVAIAVDVDIVGGWNASPFLTKPRDTWYPKEMESDKKRYHIDNGKIRTFALKEQWISNPSP